ncbi:MAG: FIST C-terminal domain-containing protein [Bacteroidetes bacterium]|nr:FIST C-terminal domain-containing protein [Bacteroidota bacterium]
MKAKSIKGKSTEEIRTVLEQSMSDGFKPTLAIAFISKSQDRKAISTLLDEKGIAIFGCTTNGEFIDEVTENGSAAILLMDINKDYFHIYFHEFIQPNHREVAKEIAQKAKQKFDVPCFLIGLSHYETDGEEILHGIEDVAGMQVNAYGGGAGDDYDFTDNYVFTNGKDARKAVLCLALDETKVEIKGVATCGWKAVGTVRTVTKSIGNHVFTVDDVPVLDLTIKYGGLENITPDNKDTLIELAANFPLQLQREKGDPVMRPGLMVDWTDRSFYTSGTVPQGSKVRFSLPPDFDVMEKVIKAVENLKATQMSEADAVVVFSCAGRILALGPLMNEEIEGVKNVWNAPMAGMFSNSELGRATGGNLEMHNATTCVVAFKGK